MGSYWKGRHLLRAGVCVCVCVLAVLALAQAAGVRGKGEEKEEWKIKSVLEKWGDEQPWHATVGWWLGKWGVREGKECEEHYGIMPCSTSLGGNAAFLVAYGFMLLKAAQLLSDSSELLLEVVSPSIIGGLVLPILGAFPDALLITIASVGIGGEPSRSATGSAGGNGVAGGIIDDAAHYAVGSMPHCWPM